MRNSRCSEVGILQQFRHLFAAPSLAHANLIDDPESRSFGNDVLVRRKPDRITYLLGIYVRSALRKDAAIKNHEAPKQWSINCDERVRSTCEQTQLFQRDLCYFDHQAPPETASRKA